MTERLYYSDPYVRLFEATITRSFDHEGRPAVTLDRTAFYPASGGQPYDTGRLGDVPVVETIDLDGDVAHVLGAPLAGAGRVQGELDWPRRFDHMQQHTGQHVLSAAFERVAENPTVSFHMGGDLSTIDLAREVTPAIIEQAEDEANRIVWDDRAVSIRFASASDAAAMSLRKESSREGTLRLIEIDDFDLSACGGTHVGRTGAIGLVSVLGWERVRGGARVTFACGGRALRTLRRFRDAVTGSVRALSVLPDELPGAIERLQADARERARTIKALHVELSTYEAARLLAEAPEVNGVRVIASVRAVADVAELKTLASALTADARAAVALVSGSPPLSVVIGRSANVPADAAGVLRQLLATFGGKGGGKPDMAQGGGLSGDAQEIAAAARRLLETALSTHP